MENSSSRRARSSLSCLWPRASPAAPPAGDRTQPFWICLPPERRAKRSPRGKGFQNWKSHVPDKITQLSLCNGSKPCTLVLKNPTLLIPELLSYHFPSPSHPLAPLISLRFPKHSSHLKAFSHAVHSSTQNTFPRRCRHSSIVFLSVKPFLYYIISPLFFVLICLAQTMMSTAFTLI